LSAESLKPGGREINLSIGCEAANSQESQPNTKWSNSFFFQCSAPAVGYGRNLIPFQTLGNEKWWFMKLNGLSDMIFEWLISHVRYMVNI
jgi:hypothetical protein